MTQVGTCLIRKQGNSFQYGWMELNREWPSRPKQSNINLWTITFFDFLGIRSQLSCLGSSAECYEETFSRIRITKTQVLFYFFWFYLVTRLCKTAGKRTQMIAQFLRILGMI